MKKGIFAAMLALLSFCPATVLASSGESTAEQICKLNEGDTVEIQNAWIEGNNVKVSVINDSNDSSANVTVTVEITYKYGNLTEKETLTGKDIAYALKSTTITIPFTAPKNYTAVSVTPVSITGTKCL